MANHFVVHVADRALDRGNHLHQLTVYAEAPNLLSLANPLAALRQVDFLGRADQLGGKVVDAGANQIRALAQRPGMTLVEAEVLGNLIAGNHWLRFARAGFGSEERSAERTRELACW